MQIFLAQFINGLALGGTYALLATGLNLMLLVTKIFQFAYAHIVVMSMYICWMALEATGGNVPLAVIATIGSGVGISLATEPIFRRATTRGATIMSLFIAIGVAMIIADVQSHAIHGGAPVGFPAVLTGQRALIAYGIVTINSGQLATILGSIGAVVTFLYLLYRTQLGRQFRAIAQSSFMARLLGIPILKTSIISYVLAGLLGGITAIFLAMSLGMAAASLGDMLALKMVAVAIFAGLGNLKGGVIAGFILGLVETFTMAYLPGTWTDAVGFGMMVIVILARPQGVFGDRT